MRVPSVSTVVCDGHPIDATLAILAHLGVRQIEPAYIAGYVDFDESSFSVAKALRLRRTAESLGVTLPTLSAHFDLGRADALEMLERRIAFAAGIGAGVLISNISTASHVAQARRTVERALPLLAQANVVLALENPGHGQNEIAGTVADLVAFVSFFNEPALRVNLDLCNLHTYAMGRPVPDNALDISRNLLASVHLKDVRSVGGDWEFCAIGEGEAIGAPLITQLASLDPAVALCLELPLRLSRPQRGSPRRAPQPVPIERCAEVVAKSMAAIGAR